MIRPLVNRILKSTIHCSCRGRLAQRCGILSKTVFHPHSFRFKSDESSELNELLKEIHRDFQNENLANKESVKKSVTLHDDGGGDDDAVEWKPLETIPADKIYEDYFILEEDIVEDEVLNKPVPISLDRGSSGVFDLEELLTVLRTENAQDICVIAVPAKFNYVEYMVIVSGKSRRHLKAMFEWINKLYKMKKHSHDSFMSSSNKDAQDWIAIDLGNIALQLFTADSREFYNLEMLWSVGHTDEPSAQSGSALDDLWSRVQAWELNEQNDSQRSQ